MAKAFAKGPTSASSNKAPKGPTSFQFVTFSDVDQMRDATAISSIRRHAMKDIGRSRRKPKKTRFVEVPIDVLVDFNAPTEIVPAPKPAIGGGGVHTFFPIPVELDQVGKALLANIWREKGDCLFNAHREDWFSVGLDDPATFNQILANSELHLEATKNPDKLPRETATSVHYHQMAVSNIRKRMALGEISTHILGCITGLLVYTEIAGAYDRWLPQRRGLLSIIESLEGGLEGIEVNPRLRAATSWVELRGSFRQDIVPAVPLPKRWLQVAEYLRGSTTDYCATTRGDFQDDVRCPLVGVYRDLTRLGSLVNAHLKENRADEARGTDIIIWTNVLAHRLLTLRPLESVCDLFDKTSRCLLESWRLAMLTVIGRIYETYGAHPLNSSTYVRKQHELLSKNKIDWEGFMRTKLWIVYVAALEAGEDTAKRRWFVMELVTSAADEGNHDYVELEERIRGVMWIPELFEARKESLKRDIERTS
ncbi:hypothetical protein M409DRAFT_17358 [Zasmidium cellare ATCC 36951]|uniref:Tachykinin family protein n=1 Tax=Zasmidium cellare ATCC 36951 TaxID=1080233 RepID=A0A6A6D128_ZASCE|nr:uncharacterized protein M409DRAFT_17358 [Zasmidium cellare ATCC 36951]KAF2172118.1 hypothetical protein M409DRAFT_17358 [Zasmidium cellare ATCC 36951]